MPILLLPTDLPSPPEVPPNRLRWTRRQCEALRHSGILTGHYELIQGEIISKMGQNPPHAYVIRLLLAWLTHLFGAEFVQIQSTLDLSATSPDYDEPEPDVAVTIPPMTAFADHHPTPAEICLVVEVADSTVRDDLTIKASLYARAGIQDYWVIDIPGRRLVVHRNPSTSGYQSTMAYKEEESVAPLARPDALVQVATLLPPPP